MNQILSTSSSSSSSSSSPDCRVHRHCDCDCPSSPSPKADDTPDRFARAVKMVDHISMNLPRYTHTSIVQYANRVTHEANNLRDPAQRKNPLRCIGKMNVICISELREDPIRDFGCHRSRFLVCSFIGGDESTCDTGFPHV